MICTCHIRTVTVAHCLTPYLDPGLMFSLEIPTHLIALILPSLALIRCTGTRI